jgi:hypothetical protein
MAAIRVTVSGSFRRHMSAIQHAVYDLTDAGAHVLSPADPRVVDAFGEFLFVASDRQRSVRLVQSRHLVAITESDFVWLVAPDGYVGPSAAMEIGFALARGVPVYSGTPLNDLTMRQFVSVVPGIVTALDRIRHPSQPEQAQPLLLEPHFALDEAHAHLESIGALLLGSVSESPETAPEVQAAARALRSSIRGL